jgi:hypothetical protein
LRNFKKSFQQILTGEIADSEQVFHYAEEVEKFEILIFGLVKKIKEVKEEKKEEAS